MPLQVKDLIALMKLRRKYTTTELLEYLETDENATFNELATLTDYYSHPQYLSIANKADDCIKRMVRGWNIFKTFDEFEARVCGEDGDDEYYSVMETETWVEDIAMHNHIKTSDLGRSVASVLLKSETKKNCLWITGPSNAGKSVFTRSIVDIYPIHGQLLKSTDFMFQDCKDVPIIYSEETIVTRDVVSDFKKVSEGAPIHANKKHSPLFVLKRTPMVCCSNERPETNVSSECTALHNRMFVYHFSPFDKLMYCNKRLNPLYWKKFLLNLN
jgi:hypothetical protein